MSIDQSIFREYDIRGTVPEQLNASSIKLIAAAIAIKCAREGVHEIVIGRDGRLSGPELLKLLSTELQSHGLHIFNAGLVTSPLLYFAAKKIISKSGIMLTGSHNPKNYNGLKIVIDDKPISGLAILELLSSKKVETNTPEGQETPINNLMDQYLEEVIAQASVKGKKFKIVVDCGNGAAGVIAPMLFKSLGHEVIELFCEIDGNFPNHHPDPGKLKNLEDLIQAVQVENADIGIAFDGDGDRLGVVTNKGEVIYPDQLMMIMTKEILLNLPGADIVFDVKCSNLLKEMIADGGGMPVMSPTGHFHIKNALKKSGAPFAGEMSGHIFYNDKWYGFDDAHYAAFRLIEILRQSPVSISELFNELPKAFSTPELNIDIAEDKKFMLVNKFSDSANFIGGKKICIDGLRVDFEDGWGLLRASNTTPKLVLRFEANTSERLQEIQALFLNHLKLIDESILVELS